MSGVTRREAIQLLGAGVVAGLWPRTQTPAIERGAIVRTLIEDLPPEALGAGPVLFHEHLSNIWPIGSASSFTDDVDLMIEETRSAGHDGVRCVVDAGHPDMGRKIDALKRIAAESGVHIVASGGYYMQRTYPEKIKTQTVDQIADDLVREAREQRLGAIGEIGQQGGVMTDDEKKVFEAVGKVQARTGLPILTHNAYTGMRQTLTPVPRDTALRQLDVLESAGAKPPHVAIGHVCCLDDPKAEIAQQIARRGAFVGFDRVTIPLVPDAQKVTTILAMVEAGYADHILISSDFYNENSLKKKGGGGVGQAVTIFAPMLLKAGMKEETLRHILADNPRRFLAFVPRS
jgi:phosphotriesterase-related protein